MYHLDIKLKNDIGEIGKAYIDLNFTYFPRTFNYNSIVQSVNIVEAYVDVVNELFSFRLGKHFIKWGSGVCFNPVDIINLKKDPLSYTSFNQGKPGIDLTFPIMDFSSISLISIVEGLTANFIDLPLIIQYDLFFGMFDGFLFVDFQRNYKPLYGANFDYTFSAENNCSLKIYSQFKYKQDTYRRFIGRSNDILVPYIMTNEHYISALIGGNFFYSFTESILIDGISLFIECYYDEENWSRQNFTNFLSLLDSISINGISQYYSSVISSYEPLKNSHFYLFAMLGFQGLLIKESSLSLGFILNIEDMSYITMPSISYKINDETICKFSANSYNGKSDSEFGNQLQWWLMNFSIAVSF